jgi:hypothetical protein
MRKPFQEKNSSDEENDLVNSNNCYSSRCVSHLLRFENTLFRLRVRERA